MSHADFEHLTAGYVLGALEPDDEDAFTGHLASCQLCQTAVRELEQVVGELPHAVPQARPPRSVRTALRRRIGYRRHRRTILVPHAPARRALAGRVTVILGVLVLFALSFWNMTLRNQVAIQSGRLTVMDSASGIINDPNARVVRLTSPNGSRARGTVFASSARGTGVLLVEGLADPAPGRVYQLWVVPPGSPPERALPGRTWLSSSGPALIRFDGFQLEDGTAFLVTSEPRGGGAAPTLPPVLTSAATVPTTSP